MDKYRLVEEQKGEMDPLEDVPAHAPEVRITQQGKPRNYITYAMNLLVSTPAAFDLCLISCEI